MSRVSFSNNRFKLIIPITLVVAGLGTYLLINSFAATATCSLNATTANFSTVFSGASGGSVICLASGDYGTWTGGTKSSTVTITPAPGANPTLSINFNSAAKNITIDGFQNFGGWQVAGTTNIVIKNTKFTSSMQATGTNAGLLLDNDIFDGLSHGTWEGRLSFGANASGGTVSNSHFGGGGCSDGIQFTGGANNITVKNNEFANIKEGSCTEHADPIQFYGGSNVTIDGNYFHDNSTGIMSGDGNGSPMTIKNNVFQTDGEYAQQVVIGGGSGDIIDHNTFINGASIRVGKVNVGFSSNETITNNIISGGFWFSESQSTTGFTINNNLIPGGSSPNINGTPTFVGGAIPTNYAGYALATGSPGKGAASDGKDIGIDVQNTTAPSGPTANFWIDSSGGSCTRQPSAGTYIDAQACSSIDAAYQVASPGDTVRVRAGTYGGQTISHRAALDSGTCRTTGNGCINILPDSGASVTFSSVSFGSSNPGPSNISMDATGGTFTLGGLFFKSPSQIVLRNLTVPGDVYMAGGSDIAFYGGEYGPFSDDQGTHPEIQASGGFNNGTWVTNLLFDGGYWHDYNTTNATAHVDCLQIENADGVTVRNSYFTRCGSVAIRNEGVKNGLFENNVFDQCADIPYSVCYYSSDMGNGSNIVIRYNTFLQAEQPTSSTASNNVVRYGNTGLIGSCQSAGTNITYHNNVWKGGTCSSTDVSTTDLKLNADGTLQSGSPAIDKGDVNNYPSTDKAGHVRFTGLKPDAGAYEYQSGTPTPKPGDTNNDGLVNIVDLSTLLSHYNTNYTNADFNKDNIVNITDLSVLLSNFGK